MQRLSSNFTLFLKIFVPTAWVSFFGLFGLVIFILGPQDEPFLTSTLFRTIFVVLFLAFALLLYLTVVQLKRVETEGEYIFATNYFKSIRFPIANIEHISYLNLGLFKVASMKLHNKGIFGKKLTFLAKRATMDSFQIQNENLFKKEF